MSNLRPMHYAMDNASHIDRALAHLESTRGKASPSVLLGQSEGSFQAIAPLVLVSPSKVPTGTAGEGATVDTLSKPLQCTFDHSGHVNRDLLHLEQTRTVPGQNSILLGQSPHTDEHATFQPIAPPVIVSPLKVPPVSASTAAHPMWDALHPTGFIGRELQHLEDSRPSPGQNSIILGQSPHKDGKSFEPVAPPGVISPLKAQPVVAAIVSSPMRPDHPISILERQLEALESSRGNKSGSPTLGDSPFADIAMPTGTSTGESAGEAKKAESKSEASSSVDAAAAVMSSVVELGGVVRPEEAASMTTEAVETFKTADKDHDDKLSHSEIKKYLKSSPWAVPWLRSEVSHLHDG